MAGVTTEHTALILGLVLIGIIGISLVRWLREFLSKDD